MLSKKQISDVCLFGASNSAQCRYLTPDDNDPGKFYCQKKSPQKMEIDTTVEDTIRESIKRGKDPKLVNVPLGDNCEGYPVLKHIEQGYDVPKKH